MSWNSFTEFVQTCRIPNDDLCRLQDIDTIFIAVGARLAPRLRGVACVLTPCNRPQTCVVVGKRPQTNPDRFLVRFEFLESLVRLAIARFMKGKSQQTTSPAEAVRKLLTEHVLPKAGRQDLPMRWDRLWCEEVRLCARGADARGLPGAVTLRWPAPPPWRPRSATPCSSAT